jgi:hypothetical protein
MQWDDPHFSDSIVVGARYGGAIGTDIKLSICYTYAFVALTRDDTKMVEYKGHDSTKSTISIYSSSGGLIRRMNVRTEFYTLEDGAHAYCSGTKGQFEALGGLMKSG